MSLSSTFSQIINHSSSTSFLEPIFSFFSKTYCGFPAAYRGHISHRHWHCSIWTCMEESAPAEVLGIRNLGKDRLQQNAQPFPLDHKGFLYCLHRCSRPLIVNGPSSGFNSRLRRKALLLDGCLAMSLVRWKAPGHWLSTIAQS